MTSSSDSPIHQQEQQDIELISELLRRARKAQEAIAHYSQEQIDDLCLSVAWEVYNDANIRDLAETAVRTTGMGNVPDKITKHKVKVMGVLRDIRTAKTVGCIERNEATGISKYAKPVGVVGALLPVTNPTATPASNGLGILKGRNAVIFAPHPRGAKASALAAEYMRKGLERVGAPLDLVQIIREPSIPRTNELMRQVDLVLATGGGPMVKAAYSSGTPSYGVGPGNSVQIIAEDADVEDAVQKIALSKAFDHATSCSSENSVIIHESLYEEAIRLFQEREQAVLVQGADRTTLQNWLWQPNKKGKLALNPEIVAKSASVIARDAGLNTEGAGSIAGDEVVGRSAGSGAGSESPATGTEARTPPIPESTRILLVEGTMPIEADPFAGEKLSPVLTLYKYGASVLGTSNNEGGADFNISGSSGGDSIDRITNKVNKNPEHAKEGNRANIKIGENGFEHALALLIRLTNNAGTGHSCGIHTWNADYIHRLGMEMRTSRIMVRQAQAPANGGNFFNAMPSTVTLGCGTWGGNITSENIHWKHFINVTWVCEPIDGARPSDEEIWGSFWKRYS